MSEKKPEQKKIASVKTFKKIMADHFLQIDSATKDPKDLNTAAVLQKFHDIRGGLFGPLEIPRAGLEYLPPQGTQTTGKLHFCWGQHFQFERDPSHGWCELDLSSAKPAGPWRLGDYTNFVTNDYLVEIPKAWSQLATNVVVS